MTGYRRLSLWHDTLPEGDPTPRPPLDGSIETDVAIVGAGYTGLWTAYYLKGLQPDLDVAVVEAEIAGFGASGRNGGWASGELEIHRERAARTHGRQAVTRLLREVLSSIDEIGKVASAEGIDCHFAKGGTITLATYPAHLVRLAEWVEGERRWGFGEDDLRLLDRDETARIARSDKARGALYTPHCAAIQPARLARGLAEAVERRGVRIYEQTPATSIEPGRVRTRRGDVRARSVLCCTEAFTARLPGGARRLVPVYSLMIATEPLPDQAWDEIGLDNRPTFNDARRLIIYGQRTADGRFAFGGRGAPYRFGSALRPELERHAATHAALARTLAWLFPPAAEASITHAWGGAVAVPRDWSSAVRYDPDTGFGYAGGYVGSGVTASNLAGRTLADLVLGRNTDLVGLPWVGHRWRRWEPEPLRWLGVNLTRTLARVADGIEARSARPSRLAGGLLDRITGH